MEERLRLGLEGLLPPSVQTMDQQLERIHHQLLTKETPIQKHIELMNLRQRNERLFYAYVIKNLLETASFGVYSDSWRRLSEVLEHVPPS